MFDVGDVDGPECVSHCVCWCVETVSAEAFEPRAAMSLVILTGHKVTASLDVSLVPHCDSVDFVPESDVVTAY